LSVKNTYPKVGIGLGLFANRTFKKGKKIVFFGPGDVINKEEANRRRSINRGGYMISFAEDEIHDLFNYRHFCFASMANSSSNVVDMNNRTVTSNARLVLDQVNKVASLEATKEILCHTEVVWYYGNQFCKFP
jgi:hypothetical protein